MKKIEINKSLQELIKHIQDDRQQSKEQEYPIYIIAGTSDQARHYIRKAKLDRHKCQIVSRTEQFMGIPWEPKVVFYGTYYHRKDYQDLVYLCTRQKARVKFVETFLDKDFQESSNEEELTVDDIMQLLDAEIKYCEETKGTFALEYQKGFIQGVKQAKNLIREANEAIQ